MKTLGRILIVLVAAVMIGAAIYFLVDSNASSLTPGGFPGSEQFRPGGDLPDFDGDRPERGERGEMRGGWIFGLIKNTGVIALFVTVIVLPSSLRKKKRAENQNPEGMT